MPVAVLEEAGVYMQPGNALKFGKDNALSSLSHPTEVTRPSLFQSADLACN